MSLRNTKVILVLISMALVLTGAHAAEKLRALIVDGQNNHDWRHTTPILKWILEESGRFTVDVATAPGAATRQPVAQNNPMTPEQQAAFDASIAKWKSASEARAKAWEQWRPHFRNYDVVIGNYNGELWPETVRADFVGYVRNGGGYVSVHAADNAFPEWPEYNEMIGLGGWGQRSEKDGPMIRFREGKFIRDNTPGPGGNHGAQHEFLVVNREPDHPILKDLPVEWMHATDELYAKLRGPAKNLTVLATAFSSPNKGGTGENEPMLMVVNYGRGRIFHTTLGHAPKAMSGLGFQITLARGAEWAATGRVTLPPPASGQLTSDKATVREPNL